MCKHHRYKLNFPLLSAWGKHFKRAIGGGRKINGNLIKTVYDQKLLQFKDFEGAVYKFYFIDIAQRLEFRLSVECSLINSL